MMPKMRKNVYLKVSVRRMHVDSYGFMLAQALGVSSGSF
jgi:hypothetical protein